MTILLPLLWACGGTKKQEAPAAAAQLQVKAMVLTPQYFESRLIVNANLLPYEEAELKAPVAGNVLSISFEEGQRVIRGQALVHIDDRVWKARLKGLQAQLSIASSDLQRGSSLLEVRGVSEETIDKLKARIDELQAQIEELEVSISLAHVTAPFNGRVGMRDFSVGAYLSQGATITSIVQADRLKVDFEVPERYLLNLSAGEKVRMVYHSDTLTATVYAVDPKVDPGSRTIRVRCVMPNPNEKFLPGIFVEVIIPIRINPEALVVPSSAIIPALNTQTVYLYRQGRAYRTEVELGDRTDVLVEVLNGLSPGDTVITTGLMEVRDQGQVQITGMATNDAL
ncbi:MAG: efflux RND transporter periplasmic adaptor subunit [Bacteroidales bacterium]|nr:efflux RND transporter periplasmic adaptor subunit [Bacteroidales bacterium]